MILEHVILPVRAGREAEFEVAFAGARMLVESSVGFRALSLTRGVEEPGNYLLLIEWHSVDAHEIGFRGSPSYSQWSAMLHGFYDPFPTVAHFEPRQATQFRAGVRPDIHGGSASAGQPEVATRDLGRVGHSHLRAIRSRRRAQLGLARKFASGTPGVASRTPGARDLTRATGQSG